MEGRGKVDVVVVVVHVVDRRPVFASISFNTNSIYDPL